MTAKVCTIQLGTQVKNDETKIENINKKNILDKGQTKSKKYMLQINVAMSQKLYFKKYIYKQ